MPIPAQTPQSAAPPARSASSRRWRNAAVAAGGMLLVFFVALLWASHHAEPELRKLVLRELENGLHCKVELDALHVGFTLTHGPEVTGTGLRIASLDGTPRLAATGVPMLTAQSFHFEVSLGTLFFRHPGVVTVYVRGATVTLPSGTAPAQTQGTPRIPGLLLLSRVIATDAKLVLETGLPAKPPVEFDFQRIVLDDLGVDKPFAYEAVVAEPKPIGIVHAKGHLGPWISADPRQTPVDGNFHFEKADISDVGGLAGTMSASGYMSGTFGSLAVNGTADIPDFALEVSSRPVALHANFAATADNATGDITFQQATAQFLRTTFTGQGSLTRTTGIAGYDLQMDLSIQGRNEEVLAMLSKSTPPLLNGDLSFRGHLSVTPGERSVLVKSHLLGASVLHSATWGDRTLQQATDALSQRAQGNAREAKADPASIPIAPASVTAQIDLASGTMSVTHLVYTMPGASILMQGTYPLLTSGLDFHGVARTAARASEMTTGWKSLLLKPVSPLLSRHGAGTELPVKLTGSKSSPVFGLDISGGAKDVAATGKTVTRQNK